MCCGGHHRSALADRRLPQNQNILTVENLRGRLAETETRLARAKAREAELNLQLDEMKRFVSVMEILESYIRRQFLAQEEDLSRLRSTVPAAYGSPIDGVNSTDGLIPEV